MSLWDKVKNLDRTFSWSFFGFFLGIGGLGFGIWSHFVSPSPKITYEILTNTPVLDVREEVDKLDIFYDGNNISEENQSLQVITFRIINSGRVDIGINSYDPKNAPLGLRLEDAVIAQEPKIISTNDEYFLENLNINILETNNEVSFNPVILNSGDFFTIKLLALTSSAEINSNGINLVPVGKIAGIKEIQLIKSYSETFTTSQGRDDLNKDQPSILLLIFIIGVRLLGDLIQSIRSSSQKRT